MYCRLHHSTQNILSAKYKKQKCKCIKLPLLVECNLWSLKQSWWVRFLYLVYLKAASNWVRRQYRRNKIQWEYTFITQSFIHNSIFGTIVQTLSTDVILCHFFVPTSDWCTLAVALREAIPRWYTLLSCLQLQIIWDRNDQTEQLTVWVP